LPDATEILRARMPFALPTGNALKRMHWARYRSLKERIAQYVFAAGGGRGNVGEQKASVQVTCWRMQMPDDDNAAFAAKPAYDVLVKLGYAAGDAPDQMTMLKPVTHLVRRRKDQATEIVVTVVSR
jgi:hypothetical protein